MQAKILGRYNIVKIIKKSISRTANLCGKWHTTKGVMSHQICIRIIFYACRNSFIEKENKKLSPVVVNLPGVANINGVHFVRPICVEAF